jgi:hypothetical protein
MKWRRITPIVVATMVMMLVTAPTAQAANAQIIPPTGHPYGLTYAQWSVAWWQWAFSIPVHNPPNRNGTADTISHPLVDTTGAKCGVGQEEQRGQSGGQHGQVWFLGGQIVQNGSGGLPKIERTCTIPSGKALFFPLANAECSVEEGPDNGCPGTTPESLFNDITPFIDTADKMSIEVKDSSGKTELLRLIAPGSKFRVKSPPPYFSYRLPVDDVLSFSETPPKPPGFFPPGTYSPAVADGYFVMLAPLSRGKHDLHFKGTIEQFQFTLDVTYHLTVT